jgi:hypothetical protein
MRVNKIEPLRTLKFADLTQDSRKKESPSRRKSKASGQGQVSKPFGTHTGLPGLNLSPKTWPNRENGVYQPSLGERGERFLDGTASRVVLRTRIKLCEGKKAKGPASLYGCVSLRLTEDGWKLRISDHNLRHRDSGRLNSRKQNSRSLPIWARFLTFENQMHVENSLLDDFVSQKCLPI